MYRLVNILAALALGVAIFAVLLWHGPEADRRGETLIWTEPKLEDIFVYGENVHFTLQPGFGEDVLLINGQDRPYYRPAASINRGLYLPELKSGLYRVYASELSVLAPKDFELSGYTISRGGVNLRYRFYSEQERLVLSVEAVSALPEEVFDIIIDAGHGGDDKGAARNDREEKEENLRSSLYMAELFRAAGLKVALTRAGDYTPGHPGDIDANSKPYVTEGRVHLGYSSAAKYYISNHLNGSPRPYDLRGWQLFRSVQADDSWQRSIAAAFLAYGHQPNDSYPRLGTEGIYLRYSQDNAATGSDYYYILRETGGQLTFPRSFSAAQPDLDLRQGAEGMLVEYLFLVNLDDMEYWDENWQGLVEAVVAGCLDYWGIK